MSLDRDALLARLKSDLMGPFANDEVLSTGRPSDTYLTGILWPRKAVMGPEEDDRLDTAGGVSPDDDVTEGSAEEIPMSGLQRPCSAGLSFATVGQPSCLDIVVRFALYRPQEAAISESQERIHIVNGVDASLSTAGNDFTRWVRRQFEFSRSSVEMRCPDFWQIPVTHDELPAGISLRFRTVGSGSKIIATIVIVNEMVPATRSRDDTDQASIFQVSLEVRPANGTRLVSKPDQQFGRDEEDLSAALLYRGCPTFAVGHTCSARWKQREEQIDAEFVRTEWLPRWEVPFVSADGHSAFRPLSARRDLPCLDAQWLAAAPVTELGEALHLMDSCYGSWIKAQRQQLPDIDAPLRVQAERNLALCESTRSRIAQGIDRILADGHLLESFRLANLAMQVQYGWNRGNAGTQHLSWRPFQLAFILLSAVSTCDRTDPDRSILDLLWFPTGGGKTEAYLGLIAMVAFYRRLCGGRSDARSGVAAVMRYTLRLLTTQQFVRASALVLACESLRRGNGIEPNRARQLGTRPFSIGLWLGGDATPNSFDDASRALAGARDVSSPEQLVDCPCCHSRLSWKANPGQQRIEVRCVTPTCAFGSSVEPLPIWTVDSDVYRERPTLLIGTVDKFAQMPRRGEVRTLFGMGTEDTPDLIIQDELHLISGPLGTVVALYEVAFDWLVSQVSSRPKVIGSTATIRRAKDHVSALFDRKPIQFPPPGINHHDSGFAIRDGARTGRLYVGVTTAGRSAKFALQAVAGCLLQAASGALTDPLKRDPYSTLVAYFNSLRELGGALVLMQDDVGDSIQLFSTRHGEQPREMRNIEELTSRRTQEEVRDMLDKLAIRVGDSGALDAVLATNMLSVGVDIPRLGLMVVHGQPKTRSEYIQATGRVGRDRAPGLVVSILNNAKPRDRSHYESFPVWHQSLYRDVEATSVTPFASRSRDRGLRGILAAMVRHTVAALRDSPRSLQKTDLSVGKVVTEIVRRASVVDPGETAVRAELDRYLSQWEARQPKQYWNDFRPNESLLQSAERAAALRAMGNSPGAAWPTPNNMRSVEPGVRFRLAERLQADDDSGTNQP